MKLYATTTSERASKGQGGNNKLVINLLIDPVKRKEIGNVVMTQENGLYTVYYYPINENCTEQKIKGGRVLLYQEQKIKGEKQKTAKKVPCMNCGTLQLDKDIDYLGDSQWNCPNCKKDDFPF